MSNFAQKVFRLLAAVPRGRVTTYGALAAAVATPRAARVVGYLLRHLPAASRLPWQRVVNARGMISIENLRVPKAEQARRLQKEGVRVRLKDGNYWVDLKKYFWNPFTKGSLRGERRADSVRPGRTTTAGRGRLGY